MKIETEIKQAQKALDTVLQKLNELEKEKAGIMKKYTKANDAEKKKIEKEMSASVKKYQKLSEAALLVSQKIKKMTSQCC